MSPTNSSRLFSPIRLGNVDIKHRVGMAPLTRLRATAERVPTPLMKEYYGQRAAVPGTLIISEGTFVSPNCGTYPHAPGIWREDQISGWKAITDEVHAKGCFIYCQLFTAGRVAEPEMSKKEGFSVIGPSAIPSDESGPVPREMTLAEIKQTVQDFTAAARNAMKAGFDGVEIHGANGYLLDQFLQDVSNKRTDEYGGSVENRSRLIHEVMESISDAIGHERVGLRLSPWSSYQGMKMADPIPQFTDIVQKAKITKLSYIHLVEARITGAGDSDISGTLDFLYDIWDGVFLIAGGYTALEAEKLVTEDHPDKKIIVIFGRYFVSNPDLVYRIREGLDFSDYDRSTFYVPGSPVGYTDYSFSKDYLTVTA